MPDIFDDPLSKDQRKKSAGKPVLAVPQLDGGSFSLGTGAPKQVKKSSGKQTTKKNLTMIERERQPYAAGIAPPSMGPGEVNVAAIEGGEEDDSFDDDDSMIMDHNAILPPPPGSQGSETRLAELELRLAQSNMELVTMREKCNRLQSSAERESEGRRRAEEELRALEERMAKQRRKEVEENSALESALSAIEAQLSAANSRANDAERRLAEGGGATGGEARRQAANLALEFRKAGESTNKAVSEMRETMGKLGTLLQNFEKIVPLDE